MTRRGRRSTVQTPNGEVEVSDITSGQVDPNDIVSRRPQRQDGSKVISNESLKTAVVTAVVGAATKKAVEKIIG